MAQIKLTTWNIEHMRHVVGDNLGDAAVARQQKIVEEIRAIDPGILCIVEASPDIVHMRDFAASALGGDYMLPVIPGTDAALAQNPHDPPAALRQLYRMKTTPSCSTPRCSTCWPAVPPGRCTATASAGSAITATGGTRRCWSWSWPDAVSTSSRRT